MKTPVGLLLSLMATMVVPASSLAVADDPGWPLWSGPSYNLTSPGGDVFRDDFRLDLQWVSPLGSGYSGIAVVDDKVITAFSDGESDFLAALASDDGEELWRYRIAETYEGHDQSEDGPRATPTIHDGRVFGLGPWGHLVALGLDDGAHLWSIHAVDDLGGRKPFAGFASAPTVIGGVLVMQVGGSDGRSISGLDPATGQHLWSAADDFVMYQSPVAVRIGGEELIFAVTDEHVLGLWPRTGEVLWKLPHKLSEDEYHGISQPVLVDASSVLGSSRTSCPKMSTMASRNRCWSMPRAFSSTAGTRLRSSGWPAAMAAIRSPRSGALGRSEAALRHRSPTRATSTATAGAFSTASMPEPVKGSGARGHRGPER
jgi:outer membrane protein assembly factor BamB